jgi:hypothetical protein
MIPRSDGSTAALCSLVYRSRACEPTHTAKHRSDTTCATPSASGLLADAITELFAKDPRKARSRPARETPATRKKAAALSGRQM